MARMDADVVMMLAMTKDKTTCEPQLVDTKKRKVGTRPYANTSDVWLCSLGTVAIVGRDAVKGDPWRGHALGKYLRLVVQ